MVSAENGHSSNTEEFEVLEGPGPPSGQERASSISIIHFNDVYNVEEQPTEPVGGAARFKTAFKSFSEKEPLILFSGDILAPSIMSSSTHGEQMIPVLNQLNVHCAVYGNHDFDFGLDRLMEVSEATHFPWLMSNVLDDETDRPLADGKMATIFNWKGWRIGIIGLVEEEWLCTLATINMDEVSYFDFVQRGTDLARQLRNQGCDYIIALTHMRTPNDMKLAENVEEIDLILGGHDHVYEINKVNGKIILKSGTDFREFSHVTLTNCRELSEVKVDIQRIEVTSKYSPDPELKECLVKYEEMMNDKMDQILGKFSVDLDGRFASIRTSETNLGNFVCDIMLASCNADLAILNSGTLRSDRIHRAGEFSMRDLVTILPMLDSLCVLEVTGKQILAALENGVSQYPMLEGRFPQVSGVHFAFNPKAPPGCRIYKDVVKIGDELLNEGNTYRMATKAYVRQGKDGYDMFTNCRVLQDDEQCPMLSTSIQNHFQAIKSKLGNARRTSTHRQSLLLLSRRHSLIRLDEDHLSLHPPITAEGIRSFHLSRSPPRRTAASRSLSIDSSLCHPENNRLSRRRLSHEDYLSELEEKACSLSPKVEGRILQVDDEGIAELRKRLMIKSEMEDVPVIVEVEEPPTPTSKNKPSTP